jgi:DNA polymerase-3 subunit epsilon
MPVAEDGSSTIIGVVDVETTGLDCRKNKMIELALVQLKIDTSTGDVLDVAAPCSWVEDPGEPLTNEIENLTGLTDAELAGRKFDDEEIRKAFANVDVIAAHNVVFDRGFLAVRFPKLDHPVACSLTEVDWQAHGLDGGRSISGLLTAAGHFPQQAHRAGPDAWALSCLLMMRGAEGRSIAWHLVDRARRPTSRVYAYKAPYAVKDTLRAAGYRWAAPHRAWMMEGEPERIGNEALWLASLHPAIQPRVVPITWHNRHGG